MIPHILHIKNFLSYGPETQIIDFRPYNLISLSGKNGHGKSALLDAITWSIWGQARKSSGQSKPDSGLMHLGQKHMMVILEFEVNGTMYRVRREYLQTQSKPFATLDFGVQNQDGKLIPLTDKTIKDTQDKIDRTIGITYESFVNSTFLRQGQSNEFSKKSPKERKEVLAQILQLQRFEQQKKIALAHARKLQQEYQLSLQIQERINLELDQLKLVDTQCQDVIQKLSTLEKTHKEIETKLLIINTELQKIKTSENEALFIQKQKNDSQEKLNSIITQINAIKEDLKKSDSQASLQELKNKHVALTKEITDSKKAYQEKIILKEKYLSTKEQLNTTLSTIQKEFEQKKQKLEINLTHKNEKIKQISNQLLEQNKIIQTLEIQHKNALHENNEFLKLMSNYSKSSALYEQEKLQLDLKRQEYQSVCAQGTYLKQHKIKIEQNIQHLTTDNHDSCIMCQQPLDQDNKDKLLTKLHLEIVSIDTEINECKEKAQSLKTTFSQIQESIQKHQSEHEVYLQAKAKHEQQLITINNVITQEKAAQEKLNTIKKEDAETLNIIKESEKELQQLHQEYEKSLEADELKNLRQILTDIETEGKKLIILSPQDETSKEEELTALHQKISQQTSPDYQIKQEAILTELNKQIEEIKIQITKFENELKNYQNLKSSESHFKKEESQLLQDLETNKKEYQLLLIEKGSLEHKKKKSHDLSIELNSVQAKSKNTQEELVDYQEICKALGKDGIQALLIEQAIPEIEHETNQILSRLTNNQTQIFIESLKDLKKGGSKETLDIKIADSFGIRDYEMFSGGEAFRIDFALRIGISKLLARRAGTTLQTIFIDEGFGSQDEEGLGLIMDNIYKIQEDFAKIVVVSHLPEMKEQFPVQFVVEKKRSGSIISVTEQG